MATTTTTTTIDDLPEGLLTHIISFLPVVDAIDTAPVSSKWRRLWLSTPTLDLCIYSFAHRFDRSKSPREIRLNFVKFASELIILRIDNSFPLHKFELAFDYKDDRHKKFVNFGIKYAVAFKCKLLSLIFVSNSLYSDKEDDDDNLCIYEFDFSSLIKSSVEELKLHRCKFLPPSARITSVKSLYLENYVFEMDKSKLTELIPLCVNLELLSIEGTGGWDNLYISSSSLKELILSLIYGSRLVENSVEIHAPNLRSVSFDQVYVGKCIIQDAKSLVEASLLVLSKDTKTFYCWSHIIASLTDVERLTVENMWNHYKFDQIDEPEETVGQDESDTDSDTESLGLKYRGKVFVSQKIFSKHFAFNNLKYLMLLTGYEKRDVLGLGLCLEMCPKLETLVLGNVEDEDEDDDDDDDDDLIEMSNVYKENDDDDLIEMSNVYKEDDDDDLIEISKNIPVIMEIPKLRQVSLMEYRGSRNEVYVVGLLKKHKVVLENITAFPAKVKKRHGNPIILWTSSSSV